MGKRLQNKARLIGLLLGPLLFFAVLSYFHPAKLGKEANAVLATTLWVAVWWITEPIPIAATSLLPIVLLPLTGGMDLASTTSSFGHKYVFLYVGGFIIAIAIERWQLHKRISLHIIHIIGTDMSKIILGFMVATAFMSMWISNTATTVMMLPIGMSVISQFKNNPATNDQENQVFGKALMLAIAYSASIGGIATLIGTPPNLVFAGIVHETYHIDITFSQWITIGLPISCTLLFICWKYLTKYAFSFRQKTFPNGRSEIKRLLNELGSMKFEEKLVLSVFVITAFLWISRSLLQKIIPSIDDTLIAIAAGVSLFLLPSQKKGQPLLKWEEAVKLPWGIILLFGGGIALAEGFKVSGLATWIGHQMTLLQGLSLFLLVLILIISVNFLTEITSNVATTAMLLPVLAPMAITINVHPFLLMVSATVAASCAFMLPVATPPNAVVFGSGYLRICDMARIGIWMNFISIIVLSIIIYFLLPRLWGFEPNQFSVI